MTDSNLRIITNGARRDVLSWADLSKKERAEFDHYRDADSGASYVRYRGAVYDLSDTPRAPADFAPWEAHNADTYFSGVLFRFTRDGDSVIAGRYYVKG